MSVIEILARGLRPLHDVVLPLGGLTVLIGDNGTGKSSIVEALAILSEAPSHSFLATIQEQHLGPFGLLSDGGKALELGVGIRSDPGSLWYRITLSDAGGRFRIVEETVHRSSSKAGGATEPPELLFRRSEYVPEPSKERRLESGETILAHMGGRSLFGEISDALRNIDVHLPMSPLPVWAPSGGDAPMRSAKMVGPAKRLEMSGGNLVDAYYQLRARSRDHWEQTRDWIRLGLGPDVVDVLIARSVTFRRLGFPTDNSPTSRSSRCCGSMMAARCSCTTNPRSDCIPNSWDGS